MTPVSIYELIKTEIGFGQPTKIIFRADGIAEVNLRFTQEKPLKYAEIEHEGIGYWIIEDDNIVQ